jgi:transmembrane sensor
MDSTERIEAHAAAWLVKRDSGEWSDEDAAALNAWLDADIAHCVAFIRLEAAWEHTRRLQALGAGSVRGVTPPRGQWQISPLFEGLQSPLTEEEHLRPAPRTRARLIAIAATLIMALGVGLYFATSLRTGDRYVTPIGGVSTVPMDDGSRVTLNTGSEVRIAVTAKARTVELEEGEAFFEVVHDINRPFVVSAGNKRVIAVGTRFSVRREKQGLRVLVTEGAVRIEDAALPARARVSAPAPLTAGTVASTGTLGVSIERIPLPEIEDQLSWRTGYLVFHEISLGEAAAEFNRYNARQIVIEDPALADIRLSGKFRAGNLDAFVRLLEHRFAVRTHQQDQLIVLSAGE